MKERIFDTFKWGIILIIAGIVFYVVFPKYVFMERGLMRCNTITGKVEIEENKKFVTLLK